ncbi:hypothetical protein PCE1_001919 [Barthelona sp. PCE]
MEDLNASLMRHFNFPSFREGQLPIIMDILGGHDVLVVQSTGFGKSLLYQFSALHMDRIAIIVSPLKALMFDQVTLLRKRFGIEATLFNSDLTVAQKASLLDTMSGHANGNTIFSSRLLYVTPEALDYNKSLKAVLERLYTNRKLAFIAVDEAHCLSEWGHDFRPSYRKLGRLRTDFPTLPIVALTATAPRAIRQDISDVLRLKNPKVFVSDFNKANLSYNVVFADRLASKFDHLNMYVEDKARKHKRGIIYCHMIETCNNVNGLLRQNGVRAATFHGRMKKSEKELVFEKFEKDQVDVVVATVAFGMGVDLPISYVVHYDLPKTLDNLYQESGRAGRRDLNEICESLVYFEFRIINSYKYLLQMNHQNQLSKKTSSSDSVNKYFEHRQDVLQKMFEYCIEPGCLRAKILNHYTGEFSMTTAAKNSCRKRNSPKCSYCCDTGQFEEDLHKAYEAFQKKPRKNKSSYANTARKMKIQAVDHGKDELYEMCDYGKEETDEQVRARINKGEYSETTLSAQEQKILDEIKAEEEANTQRILKNKPKGKAAPFMTHASVTGKTGITPQTRHDTLWGVMQPFLVGFRDSGNFQSPPEELTDCLEMIGAFEGYIHMRVSRKQYHRTMRVLRKSIGSTVSFNEGAEMKTSLSQFLEKTKTQNMH